MALTVSLAVVLGVLVVVDGESLLISGPLTTTPTTVPSVHIPILKFIDQKNPDGSYTYGYQSSDGSYKLEVRKASGEVRGKFGYKDPQGILRETEYQVSAPPIESSTQQVPLVKIASSVTLSPISERVEPFGVHEPRVDVIEESRASRLPVLQSQLQNPIVAVPGLYSETSNGNTVPFWQRKTPALDNHDGDHRFRVPSSSIDINDRQRFRVPASSRRIHVKDPAISKTSDFITNWTRIQESKFKRKLASTSLDTGQLRKTKKTGFSAQSGKDSHLDKPYHTHPRNTIRFDKTQPSHHSVSPPRPAVKRFNKTQPSHHSVSPPRPAVKRMASSSLDVRRHPEELLAEKHIQFRTQQVLQQGFNSQEFHEQPRHQQSTLNLNRHISSHELQRQPDVSRRQQQLEKSKFIHKEGQPNVFHRQQKNEQTVSQKFPKFPNFQQNQENKFQQQQHKPFVPPQAQHQQSKSHQQQQHKQFVPHQTQRQQNTPKDLQYPLSQSRRQQYPIKQQQHQQSASPELQYQLGESQGQTNLDNLSHINHVSQIPQTHQPSVTKEQQQPQQFLSFSYQPELSESAEPQQKKQPSFSHGIEPLFNTDLKTGSYTLSYTGG